MASRQPIQTLHCWHRLALKPFIAYINTGGFGKSSADIAAISNQHGPKIRLRRLNSIYLGNTGNITADNRAIRSVERQTGNSYAEKVTGSRERLIYSAVPSKSFRFRRVAAHSCGMPPADPTLVIVSATSALALGVEFDASSETER